MLYKHFNNGNNFDVTLQSSRTGYTMLIRGDEYVHEFNYIERGEAVKEFNKAVVENLN